MPEEPAIPGTWVTLGEGAEFGIDDNRQMWVRKGETAIRLGYASEKRLDNVALAIGSLRIYTDRS